MDIMIFIGLLILGGLLNFLWEPGPKPVVNLAKIYLLLAAYLAFSVWVFYFAGITNAFLLKAINTLIQYGAHGAHLMLGYLSGNILMRLRSKEKPDELLQIKAIINITLWAISVSVSNSFLVATVGKATHMPEMLSFFKQSGYALWFLYFIMAAESIAAISLLIHYRLKTGIWATIGLMLIMLGAVYTHWHNNDPFTDSYAAVIQLLNLSMLLLIYYFEKQADRGPADTQIYVI